MKMVTTSTPAPTHVSPRWASPIPTADGRILPTRGRAVCKWIEANCVYGEGDYLGQPVKLLPFEERFLWRLYEYDPDTDRRRYRRALLGMGKGNGKTPIAAWVAAAELWGPWNVGPRILVGAASLKQANHVFGDLRATIEGSVTLRHQALCYDLQILRSDAPGIAERVAAEAGTNDGPRATTFIGDELHEWRGRLGRLFLVIEGAVAKRKNGFTLAISTSGEDDEDLLLKQLYDEGVKIATGELVDDSFLFEWYEADRGLDPTDPEQWRTGTAQANPALGHYVDEANLRWRFEHMPLHEFLRYHWNLFNRPEGGWEVAERWPELVDDLQPDPTKPAFIGIDVALRHDGTGVVIAQDLGDRVVLEPRIWENPWPMHDHRHDEWTMPIGEIKNHLRALRDRFPAPAREFAGPAFFYDPRFFADAAEELAGEGLNMLEYPQSDARMCPASQRFFQLAMEGRLAHDGDAAFARHILNVVPAERNGAWRISKPRGSRKHIDAAVAAAIAAYEATRANEPEQKGGLRILEF
jgi:phage terminase large subunit-like protein